MAAATIGLLVGGVVVALVYGLREKPSKPRKGPAVKVNVVSTGGDAQAPDVPQANESRPGPWEAQADAGTEGQARPREIRDGRTASRARDQRKGRPYHGQECPCYGSGTGIELERGIRYSSHEICRCRGPVKRAT